MGNSLIFPVPKCKYTDRSLDPFFRYIPVQEDHYSADFQTKSISHRIPALHIKSRQKSKYLLIYFHGNCDDLGRLCERLVEYYERFEIDILAPEYPGYGIHKDKTSSSNIIREAQHVINYATSPDGLGYDMENIILIGRSLGTGVAVQLAARYHNLRAIVLISAYTSIRTIAKKTAGSISKMFIPDIFSSIDIINEVNSPILFIHGKLDEIIPYKHSLELYEKTQALKKIVLPEKMDHNRGELERDIFKNIENFFLNDLKLIDLKFTQIGIWNLDSFSPRSQTVSGDLFYGVQKLNNANIQVSLSHSVPARIGAISSFINDSSISIADRRESDSAGMPKQQEVCF